jgi:hypothetical protein
MKSASTLPPAAARAQRSPIAEPDPTAPDTVGGALRVAGWGAALWTTIQIAALLLERSATALSVVQAALAEWGAGRLGIAWSDPLAPMPTANAIVRRVARGAALGAAAGLAVILAMLATRSAALARSAPSVELLSLGLFTAALTAVRDELLLRGVVLRATRGLMPTWAAIAACGAAASAARFGAEGVLSAGIAANAIKGAALGALWVRDRGAWMACAANASYSLILGPLAHGGVVDVRSAAEAADGPMAMTVLAVIAVVALAARRRP